MAKKPTNVHSNVAHISAYALIAVLFFIFGGGFGVIIETNNQVIAEKLAVQQKIIKLDGKFYTLAPL